MVEAARGLYERYVAWYEKWSAALFGFVAVALVACGVMTWQATLANGRQDREADLAREQALECIDDRDAFAAASSQTLRDVTQERDDLSQKRGRATIAKERALVAWTDVLLTAIAIGGNGEFVDAFTEATADLKAAAAEVQAVERELRRANVKLKQAREANPVVPSASVTCATGEFVPPEAPEPSPKP